MGKNLCICKDALNNNENEANIVSRMPKNNPLEKETIKTLNSINQIYPTSENRTCQDDKSTNKNNGLNLLLEEMYKNNNPKIIENGNNKFLSEINKNDNFQFSGKFNILHSNSNRQIPNGGYENNDYNNDNNINIYNNNGGGIILKKNEFGFVSFKSFNDCNNNGVEKKYNKDNNSNNSINHKNEQNLDIDNINPNDNMDKNSYHNDNQKIEQNNSFSIYKHNIDNSKEKSDNNDFRYNNISQ